MNGLKEDVRAELRLYEPQKLSETMNEVRRIEEKNWAVNNRGGIQEGSSNGSFQTYPSSSL